MANHKRPRKKYVPKGVNPDPLLLLRMGNMPIAQQEKYMTDLRLANHMSLAQLAQGRAAQHDISALISTSNVVEALCQMGFGAEHGDIAIEGRHAILALVYRAEQTRTYTPAEGELPALQQMLALHDAQLEVISMREMIQALRLVQKQLTDPNKTARIPRVRVTNDMA